MFFIGILMYFFIGIFTHFSLFFSQEFLLKIKSKFNYLFTELLTILAALAALTILSILIAAKIVIVIIVNLVACPALALALTSLGCLMSLGHLISLCCLTPLRTVVSLVVEMLLEVLIDWPVAHKLIEEIMVFPSLQNMGQFARIGQKQNKIYQLSDMSNLFSILNIPSFLGIKAYD